MLCVIASVNFGIALAEFNPQKVVDDFRNLNVSGTGFDFSSNPVWGTQNDGGNAYRYFVARNGSDLPDLSAYAGYARIENGFRAYCIDVHVQPTAQKGTATLNYNAAKGTTYNASGDILTVGAAWLFAQYARGILPGYDETDLYDGDSVDMFYDALTVLMSGTNKEKVDFFSTSDNIFSVVMRDAGEVYGYTVADWISTYDMRDRYDGIGDFAVFVMSIKGTNGKGYQDFLYLAPADYGSGGGGVPEPATLLLWTLGCMGLSSTSWVRKRRMTKLARS